MLSWFASDYFAQSPVLVYPLIALGIFMTIFMVVSLKTLVTRKRRFDRIAALPLENDDE